MQIPGYTVLRPLGEGGMATALLARQHSLDREVVLKLLKPALAQDPLATERFLREAHISAKLHHAHIVAVHDVGTHDGQPYIAMAHEAGGSLADADLVGRPDEVLRIVRQIASALDHAHRQDVVHRDIKPENILRRDDGTYVLSDFGIAHAGDGLPALTQEGTSIGTPHYMSPEQLRGEPVDGRSDLYSLGVTMYRLLTGVPPYQGTDGWAVGMQHLSAPIPALPAPLSHLQPLLDGLLAKDPAQRLQSGAEVIARIDAITGGARTPDPDATVARPVPPAPSFAAALLDILRNPARAAHAVGPGYPVLLRPWPLTLAAGSLSVLWQLLMPLPGNSLAEIVGLEWLPPVADVFHNEAVDLVALRARITLAEAVIYPAMIAAMAIVTAAGLRLTDRSRPFRLHVAIFLQATNATALVALVLQVAVYLLAADFRYFQFAMLPLLYGYYLYAVAWTYRAGRLLMVAQLVVFLIANSLAQAIVAPIAMVGLIGYVRVSNADWISSGPNVDVFVADLAIDGDRLIVRRPANLTRTVGHSRQPVFAGGGRELWVSTAPDGEPARVARWDLRTAERIAGSGAAAENETAAQPLPGGGRLVIRDRELWREAPGSGPVRISPAGEPIHAVAMSPAGRILAIGGEERRGLLMHLDGGAPIVAQGATQLGLQVQWHDARGCFSVARLERSGAGELLCIDPESAASTELLSMPIPTYGGHAWTGPDQVLMAADSRLVLARLEGGPTSEVDLAGQRIFGIGAVVVSPDQTLLAFERNRKISWLEWARMSQQRDTFDMSSKAALESRRKPLD